MVTMADVEKFHFRLVLLGSHNTGKTSILNRFLFKKFETKYKPTVEDLFSKDFDLGSIVIKVDFLDTSGSMQFPAMRRLSITTGNAFLIVYAVDDETSHEVLKMCVAEIQEVRPDFQEIPIVFAGNKCDAPRERHKVSKEVVSNYVHYELPRLRAKVIECSCRDNINIENIFRAYLSLAKVSLSTTVSLSTKTGPKAEFELQNSIGVQSEGVEQHSADASQEAQTNRRSSSMKAVLGGRKSCDASIVSGGRSSASDTTVVTKTVTLTTTQTETAVATPTRSNCFRDSSLSSGSSNEVDLETAIQSKRLSASQAARAKPRSRSLIWRSSRKFRPGVVGSGSSPTDCRVT